MMQTFPKSMHYLSDNQIFHFQASSIQTSFHTTSLTLNTFAAATFTLASLVDNFASYQGIFDTYRIDQIELWLVPRGQNVVNASLGTMNTVIDYDDAALVTFASAQEYSNCITAPGEFGHYRVVKPRAAQALYRATFSGFGPVVSPWIDLAYADVQHYGFKSACSPTSVVVIYDLQLKATFSTKNVR